MLIWDDTLRTCIKPCFPRVRLILLFQYQMVEELVNHGASVNIHDQHGEIPLHLACARSSPAIVQLLLEASWTYQRVVKRDP